MQSLPNASVLFRDDTAGREFVFEQPLEVIALAGADAFSAALDRMERARHAGHWMAGYVSYEAGYLFEPKLRPLLPAVRATPLLCFGVFAAPREAASSQPVVPPGDPILNARASWGFADYQSRFAVLHRHLRLGDCYQGNLTFPIEAQWTGTPRAAFDALTARQPVRYGALVQLGEPIVLSRSPELFFDIDADGWIETHPMKGTAPRGRSKAEDARLKRFLKTDEKTQAENRMIVDLLRNDISLISEVGSLSVPQLFHVESYPTVHQMISRVRARLLPGLTIERIFAALFPCGSITGAPKIRAMQILNALEDGPRNAYCGAIGWIAPDGRMRFNVAIRTISLFTDGRAIYNVGGGVVFDSTAEAEYQECLLKARFATGTDPASN